MTTETMVTEEHFWAWVDEIGWGKATTNYNEVQVMLMRVLLASEAEAMRARLGYLTAAMVVRLSNWQKSPNGDYLGSDDTFADLVAHIVGSGKDEYLAVMREPVLAKRRYDRQDFRESFSYAIPYKADYEKLTVEHYQARARRLLDKGYPAVTGRSDPEPLSLVVTMDQDLGELASLMRSIKSDCQLLHDALMSAAEGDLGSFRGAAGKTVVDAAKRIRSNTQEFLDNSVISLVNDIARYLDS